MKSLLQNRKSRRITLLLILAMLALIFLARIYIVPNFHPTVINEVASEEPMWRALTVRLLDSIFVSLFVTVAVALFMFYIEVPDEEKKFDILESMRLQEIFDSELSHTDSWHFSGGMGRHTRSKTIPAMDAKARASNQHKTLKIQLLDPSNARLCNDYSRYRANLRSANNKKAGWTAEFVRREILSTILVAAIFKANNSNFEISVKLKSAFSTLRTDLGSKTAIITKEDKNEPAIVCRDGSFLFRSYKEELAQTFKIYPELDIRISNGYSLATITPEQVASLLEKLNLDQGLTTEDCKVICKTLKENKNQYA